MPRLLDLCCGAGIGADGYAQAGFEVIGVDLYPQPAYPYEFHQADLLDVLMAVPAGALLWCHAGYRQRGSQRK